MGQISIFGQILEKFISEYIHHDKKIPKEYPNQFALEKNLQLFLQLNIFVQDILFEYQIIFPELFGTILAIFIFCVILDPY